MVKFIIKNNFHKLVSIILFGSGIINVLSASGRPLIFRQKLLLEVFPLEFLHISNFFTLILGVALGITALNLYRRKRRAFIYASIFSFLSIVFHLTKGLDYEEALFSLFVLSLLFVSRKEYWVKSKIFDYRQAAVGIIISFALILVLRWATILIFGFAFSSLFAPIVFKFIKSANSKNKAKKLLEEYGKSALDYFKIWPDKSYFFTPDNRAFIAYGVSSNVAVTLGDPIGAKENVERIIKEFYEYCCQNG